MPYMIALGPRLLFYHVDYDNVCVSLPLLLLVSCRMITSLTTTVAIATPAAGDALPRHAQHALRAAGTQFFSMFMAPLRLPT